MKKLNNILVRAGPLSVLPTATAGGEKQKQGNIYAVGTFSRTKAIVTTRAAVVSWE